MDFLGKKCPVCSKKFNSDDDIVVCPKCGAPYHRDCYKEKGKCIFTDLHKKGETWHDENDEEEKEEDLPFEICPNCGRKNPKGSITCHACGEFMHKNSQNEYINSENNANNTEQGPFNPFGTQQGGIPFSVYFDPMGGVSPEEDFDGATGAEISKCVGVNTQYYMPVFSKIKITGSSRFNFAAFLFSGGWYLYRKQYLKGTILTLFMFILSFSQDLISFFYTNNMWKSFTDALSKNGISSPTYNDYFSLISSKYMSGKISILEIFILFLPYLFSLISWVLMFWCGFNGNRSYYKHTISKVKKIKADKSNEEPLKAISECGGVNTTIAWTLVACEIILMISSFIFAQMSGVSIT